MERLKYHTILTVWSILRKFYKYHRSVILFLCTTFYTDSDKNCTNYSTHSYFWRFKKSRTKNTNCIFFNEILFKHWLLTTHAVCGISAWSVQALSSYSGLNFSRLRHTHAHPDILSNSDFSMLYNILDTFSLNSRNFIFTMKAPSTRKQNNSNWC